MVTRKYAINRDVFLNENEVSFYLLGAIMADGTISTIKRSKFVGLGSNDTDWLMLIRDIISPNKPIYNRKNGHYFLKISDIKTCDWFLKWGCAPNKSLTLQMPNIPEKYLADFVRGYFDGDGSVSLSNYTKTKNNKQYCYPKLNYYICSGSVDFIHELKKRLVAAGFSPSLSKNKSNGIIDGKFIQFNQTYRLSLSDQSAIKFTNWTHYDDHCVSMPRKLQKIIQAREVFALRPGLKWNKKK